MRRRAFIRLLGSAAAGWPLVARSEQAHKLPIIGFLGAGTASLANDRVMAFEGRLHELGWIPGRTVVIEYRWTEGHLDRSPQIVAELLRLKADVIVTHATANIIAAKKITTEVPIVFAVAADPVGTGLVASLARPGGNVTGLSIESTDLAGKRLELLREVVPRLRRLAILVNADNPASALERREVETAARTLGFLTVSSEIRRADDITPAFAALKGDADALYVCADPLLNTNRARISVLASREQLPMMLDNREFVAAGGLMSYGPNIPDLFRRAADYVDKILKGAKPADLPVEQPTKFDLIINTKTAKAFGLTIPQTLLATADEVIE